MRSRVDMVTFRQDSLIEFLSALKGQERRARTQGQRIWVRLGNLVPERPDTQRDFPAYTVRIPKEAVKTSMRADSAAKKQIVLLPKKTILNRLPRTLKVTATIKAIQRTKRATRAVQGSTSVIYQTCRFFSR